MELFSSVTGKEPKPADGHEEACSVVINDTKLQFIYPGNHKNME